MVVLNSKQTSISLPVCPVVASVIGARKSSVFVPVNIS